MIYVYQPTNLPIYLIRKSHLGFFYPLTSLNGFLVYIFVKLYFCFCTTEYLQSYIIDNLFASVLFNDVIYFQIFVTQLKAYKKNIIFSMSI